MLWEKTKGQPDLKSDEMSTWTKASSWGVHLTRGQPDWSCNMLCHKMSLLGGTSDQRSVLHKAWQNVNLTWSLILGVYLTRGQPDWSSNTLGHKMSLPGGYIWLKVSLTQRSDKNVNLTQSLTYEGSIWPKVSLTQRSDKMPTWPKASLRGPSDSV